MKKINMMIFAITLILFVFALSACNAAIKSCTAEAKLCPDGSAVGRTGPNCEFAPCPGANNSTSVLENNTVPASYVNLSSQYAALKTEFALKYGSFENAVQRFKQLDPSGKIDVEKISFYVAGKMPREDGEPYFIGKGIINPEQNRCVYGYYNLVSGEGKVHEDVCEIIG